MPTREKITTPRRSASTYAKAAILFGLVTVALGVMSIDPAAGSAWYGVVLVAVGAFSTGASTVLLAQAWERRRRGRQHPERKPAA